jgi:hypothetical protein
VRDADPDVQVVVVVDQVLHDRAAPVQAHPRPDEHVLRAGTDEAVDEVLRERSVDEPRRVGAQLAVIGARIQDVCVQAVLVRGVPEAAEAGAERPPVRA